MIDRRKTLTALAATALLPACASRAALPAGLQPGRQVTWQLDGIALGRMWLWLPAGYEQAAGKTWPLVVFLHGSGERGSDLNAVLRNGPPLHASRGDTAYPFVLASPQLDAGRRWEPEELHAQMLALQQRLDVDPERSLATGLSLGGHGVWNWASAYPRDLAAIAPVCGFGDPARVPAMRQVPVRAYHGDKDDIVPLARQQACVDALRAAGGSADFIVYPGVNHGSWVPAYQDAALVPWLLAQKRRSP